MPSTAPAPTPGPATGPARHRRRRGARLAAALLALALPALAACGARDAEPAAATSPSGPAAELRLGYFANVTHATALIGVHEGLFAKALGATKLTTQVFNAGPAAVEALFAGAVDAAFVGPNPAINAFVKSGGDAVRIVSGATTGGAQLVVRPDITAPEQLRGASLATPQRGGTQDVALRWWLKEHGLSAPVSGGGDVTVVPQENAQTLEAFRAGRIDGAWLPEPWASRLVVEAGAKVLVDEKTLWPGGRFPTTLLIVSRQFLDAHPQTVEALLQAAEEARALATSQPEKARAAVGDALADLTGKRLGDAVLARAWANITVTSDPDAAALQTLLDHQVAVGLTTASDLTGIVDLRLLNEVRAARGEAAVSAGGLGQQ